MPVIEIKEENVFYAALQNTPDLVIVDLYAPWCGPCRALSPVFENIANTYPHVLVLKVNVDAVGSLASQFAVASLPTIVFIRHGKEVDRVIGADKGAISHKTIIYSQ